MVSGQANCSQVFSDPVDCFDPWVSYNYGNYLDYFITDNPITCQAQFCSKEHPDASILTILVFEISLNSSNFNL